MPKISELPEAERIAEYEARAAYAAQVKLYIAITLLKDVECMPHGPKHKNTGRVMEVLDSMLTDCYVKSAGVLLSQAEK